MTDRNRRELWWLVVAIGVTYIICGLLTVYAVHLSGRGLSDTRKLAKENSDAIAFLCESSAILQSITGQLVLTFEDSQKVRFSLQRHKTIAVLQGYQKLLRDREPCVKAEAKVLGG